MENASILHNNQYNELFTGQLCEFHDKEDKLIMQPFVYCSNYLSLLEKVAQNRRVHFEEKKLLICWDNEKVFFKVVGVMYGEDVKHNVKRLRHTRDDGICGAAMSETGQNMTMLLAVVSFCIHCT